MRRIVNVSLPQPLSAFNEHNAWWILLDDEDVVVSINAMIPGSCLSGESWDGDCLSPRCIDLQMNGGLGISFTELTSNDLPKLLDLLDLLWQDGVEAICPTFVSCNSAALREALLVLREARKYHCYERCKLLGAHLEGPFLASSRHGAHDRDFICDPSLHALEERIAGFEEEIKLVTLAPELSGAAEVIAKLKKIDVVICLGHSNADAETARTSFDQGVTMLTHTFNAMRGFHHRFPGPVEASLSDSKVFLGLIADGVHVHPDVVCLLHRLASDQLVLVSDALSPYGLYEGKYCWNQRSVFVNEGTCYLEDGVLAGVTLPLIEGCKRLARWTGEPASSIWAATVNPRRVFEKSFDLKDFLLGKSLKHLLRWQFNPDDFVLTWQRAA